MKTYSAKPSEITRKWHLIDAADAPLGRIATTIATYLTGKDKPSFTPHMDGGDYVVVINAKNLVVTGNKMTDKKYYRHSGFPGGIKETTLEKRIAKDPTTVIRAAVRGMLPKNKLMDGRLARLRIFPTEVHEHEPQQPQKVDLKKSAKGDK